MTEGDGHTTMINILKTTPDNLTIFRISWDSGNGIGQEIYTGTHPIDILDSFQTQHPDLGGGDRRLLQNYPHIRTEGDIITGIETLTNQGWIDLSEL